LSHAPAATCSALPQATSSCAAYQPVAPHAQKAPTDLYSFPSDFSDFCQAAAKIVAAVADVTRSFKVDHVALAQLRHATGIAFCLYLAKAALACARFHIRREGAAGFGAAMFFRHDFHFWQSLAISGDFGNS
jgi:hypothetical protein